MENPPAAKISAPVPAAEDPPAKARLVLTTRQHVVTELIEVQPSQSKEEKERAQVKQDNTVVFGVDRDAGGRVTGVRLDRSQFLKVSDEKLLESITRILETNPVNGH